MARSQRNRAEYNTVKPDTGTFVTEVDYATSDVRSSFDEAYEGGSLDGSYRDSSNSSSTEMTPYTNGSNSAKNPRPLTSAIVADLGQISSHRLAIKDSTVDQTSALPHRSSLLNESDAMLMELLVSQAMVDCKAYHVLSFDEVNELKKEHSLLSNRIQSLSQKLCLEQKIQEAALSLARLHASNKSMSRKANEQLSAAQSKVDTAATELWKLNQRASDVKEKLLQHTAGVLVLGYRRLEKSAGALSPTSPFHDSKHMYSALGPSKEVPSTSNVEMQQMQQSLSEQQIRLEEQDHIIEDLRKRAEQSAHDKVDADIVQHDVEEAIDRMQQIIVRQRKLAKRVMDDDDEPLLPLPRSTTLTASVSTLEYHVDATFDKVCELEQEIESSKAVSHEALKSSAGLTQGRHWRDMAERETSRRQEAENELEDTKVDLQRVESRLRGLSLLEQECKNLRSTVDQHKGRQADLEHQLSQVGNEKTSISAARQRHADLIQNVTSTLTDLDTYFVNTLQITPAETSQDVGALLETFEDHCHQVGSHVLSLRQEIEHHRSEEDQTRLLHGQARDAAVDAERWRLQAEDKMTQLELLHQTTAQLTEQLENARSASQQMASVEHERDQMKSQYERTHQDLQAQLANARSETESLVGNYKSFETHLNLLHEALPGHENNFDPANIPARVKSVLANKAGLEQELSLLEADNDGLKLTIANLKSDLQKLSNTSMEEASLRRELEESQAYLEKELAGAKLALASNEQLANENELAGHRANALNRQLNDLRTELGTIKQLVAEKDSELSLHKQEIADLARFRGETAEMQRKLDDMRSLLEHKDAELDNVHAETHKQLEMRLSEQEQEYEDQLRDREAFINGITNDLTRVSNERKKLKAKIAELTSEVLALRAGKPINSKDSASASAEVFKLQEDIQRHIGEKQELEELHGRQRLALLEEMNNLQSQLTTIQRKK